MAKVKVKKTKETDDKGNEVVEVPDREKLLAIILRENKSCTWRWLNYNFEHFQVGKHTYFKEPKGTYLSDNRVLCAVYIEGISIPISHQYIKKKMEWREYIDENGEVQKIKVPVIQNIKFDSEIVDMLLNRNLADEFLKETKASSTIAIIILLCFTLAIGVINIGLHFYG